MERRWNTNSFCQSDRRGDFRRAKIRTTIAGRLFEADDAAAAQIARLAASLPEGGQNRLEKLRGFGAPFGRTLTCACSRVAFGSEPAILVAAAEPAGPNLSLAERASRLFAGNDDAIAVFTPDGELVHATPHGKTQLAGKATLADLGYGIATDKIGDGASTLLIVRLSEFPQTIGLPASPDSPPDAEVDLAPIAQAMHGRRHRAEESGGGATGTRAPGAPNAGIPCASSGRSIPTDVSPSDRMNSSD